MAKYVVKDPIILADAVREHGVSRKWLQVDPVRHAPERHAGAGVAERLAGLEPLAGSLWHAYRRKWATERKHLPDQDVAAAGGWKDTRALTTAYQQVDPATVLEVVLSPRRLRDARQAESRPG